MYVSTICFICMLAMALVNTWMFLIKQRKYKAWPLLMFYILTIWLAAIRIFKSYFFFYTQMSAGLLGDLLAPILKLNIGAVQCWILIELGLKITLNIRLTESLM